MTESSTIAHPDCCEEHDGPHVHGCQRERIAGVQHRGRCITDRTAAANQATAEAARLDSVEGPPPVAWFQVGLEDDSTLTPYPRPHVMQILEALRDLQARDQDGALPPEIADSVRILLAVIGRLPAGGMAEAFPAPREPRRLAVVDAKPRGMS